MTLNFVMAWFASAYEPKPLNQLYAGWQEMLAEHRQVVVEVQEITPLWSLLYP